MSLAFLHRAGLDGYLKDGGAGQYRGTRNNEI